MTTSHRTRRPNVHTRHTLALPTIPAPTAAEYQALKASIAANGMKNPIDVDEQGNILDGFTRSKIADELGLKNIPRRTMAGLTPAQKFHHVIDMNLHRRHLTANQRKEIAAQLLKLDPSKSDRQIGRSVKLDKNTVAKTRKQLVQSGEIHHIKKRNTTDKPKKYTHVITDSDRQHEAIMSDLSYLKGQKLPARLMTPQFLAKARRMKKWATRPTASPTPPEGITLKHIDFRKLDIAAESVDCIFTDPLWHKEHIGDWDELGQWAKRVLKPDGILLAYAGHHYLDVAIASLAKHLKYKWMFGVHYTAMRLPQHCRITETWRPVLFFTKGKPKWQNNPHDMRTVAEAGSNRQHPYQQNLEPAKYWLSLLTQPGQLIADPFMGSGTFGVAAAQLGRKFLGCDIDANAVALARKRIFKEGKLQP